MILVDSSIWIEYWTNGSNAASLLLTKLIEDDKACINGLIYTEITQGAPTQKEFNKIEKFIEVIPLINFDADQWTKTAKLYFLLRTKGITVTTIDCLIAQHAISQDVPLFSKDKIFKHIQEHCPLKLYKII